MAKANEFAKCETISEVLGVLAGGASVCWLHAETPLGAPIFDSAQASTLVAQAEERIKEILAEANSVVFR